VAIHHGFTADCIGCCARAAARSPHYHRARQEGRLNRQYQMLLDTFGLSHDAVKAAAQADAAHKVSA
jgi:hypothetical protein